jgi:hypothetical protein
VIWTPAALLPLFKVTRTTLYLNEAQSVYFFSGGAG